MTDNTFYVGIQEPSQVRRDLLMSSKHLLDNLKRFELFKSLRQEKMTYALQLKRIVDELIVFNRKLRHHLPRTAIKIPKKELDEIKEIKPKKKKEPSVKPKVKSKFDLLEEELSRIESKLEKL